jgi:hypothetical protein
MLRNMGILSDIIIAEPAEAAAINAAGGAHLQHWPCLASKGIDCIKLWTLSQILAGRPLDDIDAVARFMINSVLDRTSDDGPWVFLIPEQLQRAIAATSEDGEEDIAAKWAATEEFILDRWQPADVEEYLHDLIAHTRKACAAGKSLLLWMSL